MADSTDPQMDIFAEIFDEGEENENELVVDYLDRIQETVTWSTDWTIESINNQIKRDSIELNPKFQRRDAWNLLKKSKLIESIILGFPIPQLVLAEDKNSRGRFIVVDGKQRLTTLNQFIENKLKLSLRNNKRFDGMTYSELESKHSEYAQAFLNQSIRSVILKNWPTDNFLFAIFYRLNSGSLPLSPQELRRALKPGELIDALIDYTESSAAIKRIFNEKHPDPRMKDVELLLRYIAFEVSAGSYGGNFKEFLDLTCSRFDSNWSSSKAEFDHLCNKFEDVVSECYFVFGDNAFKKCSKDGFEKRFSRAVFDIQTYYLGLPKIRAELSAGNKTVKSEIMIECFRNLCLNSVPFYKAISANTNNLRTFSTRFALFGLKLSEAFSIPDLVPPEILSLYNEKYKDQ